MKKFTAIFLVSLFSLFAQVNGTSGLPIGGIGTGAIKFSAWNGSFSANFITPTRHGDYQLLQSTQFQLFTKRGGTILTSNKLKAALKNGLPDDDAIFPLHYVNFGDTNEISVEMKAYIPFNPKSVSMMMHPAAMYEFTVTNSGNDAAEAALAFQIETSAVPSAIADSGFISNSSAIQVCLIGKVVNGAGNLSYGSDNGFFTAGACNNQMTTTTNRLALDVSLNPADTKTIRFVLAWYNKDDEEHYGYTALWNSAREVASSAMNNFDEFKEIDNELVSRMRGSNLPEWLTDQTLNSLVNLVNNSVYFQDGRYCHTEGQWQPEGTMDQMWHARQIYTMIKPDLAWQELEWWARTQHVQNYTGQIHHDFGTDFNYVDWDNTEHADYRDISAWVDLNCGFIISVYEAFIATADQNKLSYFWPYVKKAGQRILDQVQQYGSSDYPYTFSNSLSSYDAGGNSQAYNSGLSIVAYNIMKYFSGIMGEPQTDTIYNNAFQKAVEGFKNRYLLNSFQVGNYCESALGGPWIANFLKMGPFWDKQYLDNLYTTISNYYDPLNKGMGYPGGSYSEWQTYLVGHLGGYALQTNRTNIWLSLQKDMYERNYLDRNLVFNEQLGIQPKVNTPILNATSSSGYNQYISIPVLWRNYYDIVGFHQNKYSGELWLEPKLIDPEVHQIQNALVIMPEGYASINYNAYGDSYQDQQIVFKPDQSMNVSALYVLDLYADSLNAISSLKVNGADVSFSRTGSGSQAHLKINWTGTITNAGITIEVEGTAKPGVGIPSAPENLHGTALSPSQILLAWKASTGVVSGYNIELKVNDVFQQIALVNSTDTSYMDTGLLASKEYTYRIRAFNSENFSDPSEEIKLTTQESGNGDVLVALNAGGDTYQSSAGISYVSDASSGQVTGGSTYSTTNAISNTTDDVIYQTERYGDFSYSIPLNNDSYNVVLKFAEIYQDNPGTRIFNINIEGKEVIHNLDLYFRTGKFAAYDVVIPVELKDGTLNINFVTVTDNAKLSALEVRKSIPLSVDPDNNKIVKGYYLSQNYPNPFNPSTTIRYSLQKTSNVKLTIYNILGVKIRTLVDAFQNAGEHNVVWDGKDDHDTEVGSGVYLYKLESGNANIQKKMILLR